MKRRDFITKSTLTAAGVGLLAETVGMQVAKANEINEAAPLETQAPANLQSGPSFSDVMLSSSKARSGITLGGIGAGGAELRKDGVFYNWSIANNQPKGTGKFFAGVDYQQNNKYAETLYPNQSDYILFFILRYQVEGEEPKLKILQIEEGYEVAGVQMHIYEFPWMQGVDKIEYSGCFPFVKLKYTDAEMPLDVELNAWSPFLPHDVKNSSLPVLYFDFKVTSKSEKPVSVMITANYKSIVGYDIAEKVWESEIIKKSDYIAHISKISGVDAKASSAGEIAMASLSSDSSYQTGWGHRHQYHEWVLRNNILKNEDTTATGRNRFDKEKNKTIGDAANFNALAASKELKKGENLTNSFVMAWNFPNLYDEDRKLLVGHYYTNFFPTAKEALSYAVENKESLYKSTKKFIDAYYDSAAPQYLLDLVNSQLTTFITSGLLSKKMEFGVMEGITQHQSWGPIGTTDVNMYGGVMVSSLFPELAKSTMRVHKLLQHPGGEIRHSFKKGFATFLSGETQTATAEGVSERLDLHSQYSVMALRDFFWTNDKAFLQEMWPSVKKAIEYTLTERDKNGDQQPDMTGIMSSYDNFAMYGLASYVHSQWLAALASALEAAKVLNDTAFAKKFAPIFEKGKKLAEEKLWNGKYYRLYNSDLKTMKTKDGAGKEITKDMSGTDEGCLTDQIIGQWAAHWSGLGDIFNKEHRKAALKNILELSYKPNFGLRNCSWPGDKFYHEIAADVWVDQANTCWSGVEVSFVSFLLYEGLYTEALAVAKTVHDRYLKCGRYWDHQEFGGHYFRAMGAWGIINGLVGLAINQEVYTFSPKLTDRNFKLFFSFPGGFGNLAADNGKLNVNIVSGEWKVKALKVSNFSFASAKVEVKINGKSIASASVTDGISILPFKSAIVVKAGEKLVIG